MAYLNLRDRRIEAKVAYVGPAAGGKATNLQQLSRSSGGLQPEVAVVGDTLSLAWQPADTRRFRDCDVVVKVVTQRGGPSDDRLLELLREVDAVVLVADAEPSAEERNRECLAAVRRVLAVGQRSRVSLVVQVNKTDLPDALGAAAVLEQLDAGEVTHVEASALSGRGVVETLEAAVSDILAAMNEESAVEPTPDTVRPGGRAPAAPTEGGHPLLSALRQILRDTAREQADAMAIRVSERLEDAAARVALHVARVDVALGASAAAHRTTNEQLHEVVALLEELTASIAARASKEDLAAVASGVSRMREDVTARLAEAIERVNAAEAARADAFVARLTALEGARQADRARLDTVASELAAAVDASARAQREHLHEVQAAVERGIELAAEQSRADHERTLAGRQAVEVVVSSVVSELAAVVDAAAHAQREHLGAVQTQVERGIELAAERSSAERERAAARTQAVEEAVREAARANSAALSAATSALVSALDDRARAHREQLAAAALGLGKAIGQISADVSVDLRASVGDILARVNEVAKGLSGVAGKLAAHTDELRAIGPRVDGARAAAEERAEAAAVGLREVSASLTAGFAATDASQRGLQARVNELAEELSKPKRGWFT